MLQAKFKLELSTWAPHACANHYTMGLTTYLNFILIDTKDTILMFYGDIPQT